MQVRNFPLAKLKKKLMRKFFFCALQSIFTTGQIAPIRARRCATNATKISFLRPKMSSNELSKVGKNSGFIYKILGPEFSPLIPYPFFFRGVHHPTAQTDTAINFYSPGKTD